MLYFTSFGAPDERQQTQSPQLPEDIARELNGQINVAHWVRATAQAVNVRYAPTQLDDIASAISRLSDAEVEPDEIKQLLLALQRRGVITDQQRFTLHATYLRQTRLPAHRGEPPAPGIRDVRPAMRGAERCRIRKPSPGFVQAE